MPLAINQVWSMDFMHNHLEDGRTFRLFNIIDDFNREAIGMEVDFSLPSERVIRELKQIICWRGNSASLAKGEDYHQNKLVRKLEARIKNLACFMLLIY